MKQQEESTDMEMATMVEGRNESNKEIGINEPMAFDGSQKKVETFIQECRLYLQVNKKIYATDEAKVAFFVFYDRERSSQMEADLPEEHYKRRWRDELSYHQGLCWVA